MFSKLKERTGGRLRYFVSGGAPLAPEINKFFYAAGLVDPRGIRPHRDVARDLGQHAGGLPHRHGGQAAVRASRCAIAADGEILTRGPHVMEGYYRNEPEATREAIDADGWFHTGDIGVLDDGYLRITDRKKDIIVTAGGKNIAPQPIENAVKTNKYVSQAVMIGDKRKYPVLLVVPNWDQLERWAGRKNIIWTQRSQLLEMPTIKAKMEQEVAKQTAGLAQVRDAEEDRAARARLLDRARRADADAEGEAARDRPRLQGADRLAVRRFGGRAARLTAAHASRTCRPHVRRTPRQAPLPATGTRIPRSSPPRRGRSTATSSRERWAVPSAAPSIACTTAPSSSAAKCASRAIIADADATSGRCVSARCSVSTTGAVSYVVDFAGARLIPWLAGAVADARSSSRFAGARRVEGAGVVISGRGDVLPLAKGCVRGIALDDPSPALLRSAVEALAPGGRLVAPADAAIPAGIDVLAAGTTEQWVGEREAVPVLSVIRRAPR